MLTEPGTYYIMQPYPGNTQIVVMEFDSTETYFVIENRMLDWTLKIMTLLGYQMDLKTQREYHKNR